MTMTQPPAFAHLAPPVSVDQLVDDVDQLDDAADDVSRETAPAGTPLAALATEEADVQEEALETLEARVRLEDGRTWTAPVRNQDFVGFDLTRAKKKWPSAEEAPFILNTFLAYSASKRAGHWTGPLEAFSAQADVVNIAKGEPVPPTR